MNVKLNIANNHPLFKGIPFLHPLFPLIFSLLFSPFPLRSSQDFFNFPKSNCLLEKISPIKNIIEWLNIHLIYLFS